MNKRLALAATFSALALTTLSGAANASSWGSGASNADQARVSEKISIWEMPRNRANEIIGLLQAGEIVTIQRCTVDGNWCRVLSDQPTGWVPGSYLVGSPAKADVTPLESLTTPTAGIAPWRSGASRMAAALSSKVLFCRASEQQKWCPLCCSPPASRLSPAGLAPRPLRPGFSICAARAP